MSELFTGGGLEAAASAASAPVAADTSVSTPTPAAADASSAAGTATTPPAASDGTTGTTTTDPAAQPQQTTPTPKGPIPFEAHKTALDNARLKATQEAEAKFAWTQTIPEQHRPTVSQFYQLLDTEPTQAVEVLIQQIAADPQHAPKLRSLFGKLLGGRNAPQPATGQPAVNNGTRGLPEPDAFGEDERGNRIPFYSAAVLPQVVEAIKRDLSAQFEREVGPLKQDYRSRQDREAQAEQKRTSDAWAEKEYARIAQYPHFTEHEQEIAAAMQADDTLGVQDAYIQIVIPKLQQQERKAVVTGLHDKANASGINPAHPSSAAQAPPRSFEEALARVPASAW